MNINETFANKCVMCHSMKHTFMKIIFAIALVLICSSCKKTEEQNLLYNQLVNYRDDLKKSIKNEEVSFSLKVYDNKLYKRIFDSLNQINIDCEKSFERLRYGDEKKLLAFRDEFNSKHHLHLKFDSYNSGKNVPDSIFNRLIETDILRLRKCFMEKYVYIQGCK